jgi:hypothetical protein
VCALSLGGCVLKGVELMSETKAQRSPGAKKRAAAKKQPAARKPRAAKRGGAAGHTVEQTTELSEDVLRELEDGARSAIEAVRKFLGTVDQALPPRSERASGREEITDSALEMAQRLVQTQLTSCARLWTVQASR